MISGPGNNRPTSGNAATGRASVADRYAAASSQATQAASPALNTNAAAASPVAEQVTSTVTLSAESQMMHKLDSELDAYPHVDSERVASIKQQVNSGGYRINSASVARKMMLLDTLYHN